MIYGVNIQATMTKCFRSSILVGLVAAKSLAAAAAVNPATHRAFADDLTSKLYKNDNECTSALGVSMAFSLIWPGCSGDAIDEVRETLGYPSGTNMRLVWEDATQRMLERSSGECEGGGSWDGGCMAEAPTLHIANSI